MDATVLVVDDQDVVRDVIRLTLEGAGCSVLTAATPSAALALAASEPIDVVVADVVMPEMGAAELAARLGESLPGVPILYTSGYAEAPDGPFIQKPFTPSELVAAIQEVLSE